MSDPGLSRLLTARLVALYLLSLLAVAGADLAWRPPSLLRLAGQAVGLGVALVLGGLLADALSAVGAAGARRRARLLAFLFVPPPTLFALAAALAAPRLAPEAVSALTLLQGAVLLLGEALGLELLALWGAFVLSLVAAAAGGLPAAAGLPGFLALAGAFLALDHVPRRLLPWPGVPAPAVGAVLSDAARTVALPVLLLALALALLPLPPPAGLAGTRLGAIPEPEVKRAYQWLILLGLAGAGIINLVFRWLRGRGSDAPPLLELTESHVEAEELLEAPAPDDARYAPARGRVIRAYLRFLARAGEAGYRLERSLTPVEIRDRVRRPEDPLGTLTRLFMDARYGPHEPLAEEVHRAEAASRTVCSTLRVLPRSARRRRLPPMPPSPPG